MKAKPLAALRAGLKNKCDEKFRLLDEAELLNLFDPGAGVDGGELKRLLRTLENQRFIDLQYAEDGVYCLRLAGDAQEREGSGSAGMRLYFALLPAASFLGALLGGVLAALLS